MRTTRPQPASVIFLDTRTGGTHLRYGMMVATKGTAPRRMYLIREPGGGESWQHEAHVDLDPLFPERAGAARWRGHHPAARYHSHPAHPYSHPVATRHRRR